MFGAMAHDRTWGEGLRRCGERAAASGPDACRVWDREEELGDGYVFVPRMTVKLSAGDGYEVVLEEERDQRQAFRREWVSVLGMSPDKLVCVNAIGDSMSPEINDGDSLLVDMAQTNIIQAPAYQSPPPAPR